MRFYLISLLFVFLLVVALQKPANAEVLTWDCSFEYRVDEEGRSKEEFLLIFRVDTVSQRGFMEGNAGIVDVDVHVGDEAFNFIERTGSGAAQTTTVTRDGNAVHSRNTVILGKYVAAQHFGRCRFD